MRRARSFSSHLDALAMPRRYRLSHLVAFEVLIGLALVCYGAKAQPQSESQSTGQTAQPPAQEPSPVQAIPPPAPPAAVLPAKSEPLSAGYQPTCDKPKDREEADLCEQRRMADAAENQFYASTVGIFLVAFRRSSPVGPHGPLVRLQGLPMKPFIRTCLAHCRSTGLQARHERHHKRHSISRSPHLLYSLAKRRA
jgi:hypothetical protein